MSKHFRIVYADREGQNRAKFIFDTDPVDDDTKPKPKIIQAVLVNLKNVGIMRLVASDLWEVLNPLLVAPEKNSVSAYRLHANSNKLSKVKYQQAAYIEVFQLNARGRVLEAFQLLKCEWISRTEASVDTGLTLIGLHYRFIPSSADLKDIRLGNGNGADKKDRGKHKEDLP